MRKLLLILFAILLTVYPALAARQAVESGDGKTWVEQKNKINANFVELYNKDVAHDTAIAKKSIEQWTSGETYTENEIVTYAGMLFVAKAGGATGTDNPAVNTDEWDEYGGGEGVTSYNDLTDKPTIPADISANVLQLDNTTAFTPDADYEPATKKYVDDNAVEGGTVTPGSVVGDVPTWDGDSYEPETAEYLDFDTNTLAKLGTGTDIDPYVVGVKDGVFALAGDVGSGCTAGTAVPYKDDSGTDGDCIEYLGNKYVYVTDQWYTAYLVMDNLDLTPSACDVAWWTYVDDGYYHAAESTKVYVAGSFTATSTQDVCAVDVSVYKVGSPTGTYWVELWSDSGGSPDAVITNGTTTALNAADVTGTFSSRETKKFTFADSVSLTADTRYWIVYRSTDTTGDSNYVGYGTASDASGEYRKRSSDGTTWVQEGFGVSTFFIIYR